MNDTQNEPLQYALFSPGQGEGMAKVIEFPTLDGSYDYFGVCPKCFCTDGNLNVGREHWYHCKKHKLKWWVDSNLFSGWQYESESQWAANAQLLADYKEIQEYHPGRTRRNSQDMGFTDDDLPF